MFQYFAHNWEDLGFFNRLPIMEWFEFFQHFAHDWEDLLFKYFAHNCMVVWGVADKLTNLNMIVEISVKEKKRRPK